MSQPQKDLQIATEPPLTAEQCLSVFRDELRAGRQPEIERYLYRTPHDCHPGLLEKLLTAELQERQRRGEPISVAGYISRLPQFAASIPEIASRALDLAARESWEEPGPHDTTKVFVAENPPAKPWPVAPGPVPDEFPRGPGIIQPLLAAAPPLQLSERPQPVAKPSTESLPTRVGKYEVVRQLGKGGFGAVYLCHDPDLDDEVAVKVLRPEKNTDNLLKTLRDEGRKSRQLHNKGARVVPVLDTGTDQFGSPFMVMKFMQGGALSEQLRKRGAHTWQEAVQIIADLARTLAILHAEDIYHRDIKPLNILLDDRGQPHLADFGLAARIESLESDGSGHSPGYASPEQVLYGPSRIDGRSDLYSLGVVFYELLTGKLPVEYQRRVKGDYERRVSDPGLVIPPVRQRKPEVPEAVAALCERCLKWDRTERTQAAADLVNHIQNLPVPGKQKPTTSNGILPWVHSHQKVLSISAVPLLLLLLWCASPIMRAVDRQNNPEPILAPPNTVTAITALERSVGTKPYILDRTDPAKRSETPVYHNSKPAVTLDTLATNTLFLGEMTKANSSLILSADITNFQGDAGLFLGREIAVSKFADLSGLPTKAYTMVVLRIEGEQCRLQRIELPAPNSADRDIVIEPGGELDLKPPTSPVHLKIVVTHGKLESVQVNNTFMQIGSNFQRQLQANTACGLYIRKGRADFENVSLLID
jgi:serine/threonine protein kinase